MKLNMLLFQHLNTLQKVREEVQKMDIYCKAMTKKLPLQENIISHEDYVLLLHLMSLPYE
jgi:hypothetical protein